MPPGLVGDRQATPQCAHSALLVSKCQGSTQVGTFKVLIGGNDGVRPLRGGVYNLVPEAGRPAELGFITKTGKVFTLAVNVRTGEGYGLVVGDANSPIVGLRSVRLSLWGVPAEASHDAQRGAAVRSNRKRRMRARRRR